MKICVLSRNENLYSTKRLVEEAHKRGHEVDVLDYMDLNILIEGGNHNFGAKHPWADGEALSEDTEDLLKETVEFYKAAPPNLPEGEAYNPGS